MLYPKLEGRIVEKFGTRNNFCEKVGMNSQVLSKKLNGQRKFTLDEIETLVVNLDIKQEEFYSFFNF